jgi:ribosome-binding ATPase
MSLSVGIVGLPNVGKSTLFNALLKKQQALAANYPFATIEPNVGVVPVPDERLSQLAEIVKSNKIIPAMVEFVDIAGLVAGASKGEGLGNQFLAHIREVDLICFMVRDFADVDVVGTGVDPMTDLEVLKSELIFKDIESVEKKMREKKNNKILEKLYQGLNAGKGVREVLGDGEREEISDMFLLTDKPSIVLVNVGEENLKQVSEIEMDVALKTSNYVLALNAKLENEINELSKEDREEYLQLLGVESSGINRVIGICFEKLGLTSFLTAGEKEVRAWTIGKGMKAPQAAGVIHTDFEKKFIKAKMLSFGDFVKFGGWKAAAEAGKVRLEGRDYVMLDDDVVEFMVGN